ncbi:MAG: murein transglycosylase A [Herminiimonas sp.]|nr:murein transglycosylase A [Herminiimonas sp.]
MSFNRTSLLASATFVLFGIVGCSSTKPEGRALPTPPSSMTPPTLPTSPGTSATSPLPPMARPSELFRRTTFAALPGWGRDDLREALPALLASCEVLVRKADWKEPCMIARDVPATDGRAVRTYFESFFAPYQVINADGSDSGLITGYYEPLLQGARKRGGRYQTPLHRAPDDLLTIDMGNVYPETKGLRLRGRLSGGKVVPYPARAEIEKGAVLAGKELLWVDDPIDAFFLQVQGSGRVQMEDSNETVRVAYADQNGHPYKSIGRYLVDKGELTLDQASAQGIKAWVAAHPSRQQELLNANPSYVFFKEEKLLDPRKGPKGALGVPLTAQRSVAVDPQFIPLGVPVFLSTTQPNSDVPLQRLMLAQDTGGAIRNAVRADFFWGFGAEPGEKAGRMKQRGSLWILLPKLAAVPAQ